MIYSYIIVLCLFISNQVLCSLVYNEAFIIATEGCNITDISDERETIKAMSGISERENCDQEKQLLDSNATHIWILKDSITKIHFDDEDSLSCCYKNFSAAEDIKHISYSDCQQFHSVIRAQHEFVRVDCSYYDSVIYSDYFVFSPKASKPKRQISESTFNVIVLGLESLSRLNFERTMPKTAKFLSDRGAIQLKGYNKVGYNSFPNLFPLLTGQSFNSCKIAECHFIWKMFRDAGYYTALGSDSAVGAMGPYEYDWPTIPTDYYLQPFMAETNNVTGKTYYYNRRCLRSKPFFQIVLNYIQGLLKTLRKGNRLFGFFWEESVSHDELKKPQLMDEGYLDFVTKLENSKLLEDTILIVLSDHGMRWGGFAETRQGRLEGKLPLFSVLLPESFKAIYGDAYQNILINQGRLTTPYDAYQTLVDLVNPKLLDNENLKVINAARKSADGPLTLFLPVSENRTCVSAGIEEAWCACDLRTVEPTQKREVIMAADVLLDNINQILANFPKCQMLKLSRVLGGADLEALTHNGRTYTVVLEATPGDGIFQGMVRRQRTGAWISFGPVTRLNRYTNQPSCVEDALIKLYCSCY